MIILSGGASLIGSNLIKGLNEQGIQDTLVKDKLKNAARLLSLNSLNCCDYWKVSVIYLVSTENPRNAGYNNPFTYLKKGG
ncbi:MAG: hypothetical protein ACNS62_12280 [Candidatus Cyclobacteriaceae bacterium M3_2C_046]